MTININQLANSFENVNKDPAAFLLAKDIERLSDLLDPFGWRDYLYEFHNGDIASAVNEIYNDIVSGNVKDILSWLAENATDINNGRKDRERAENRFFRLYDYRKECVQWN